MTIFTPALLMLTMSVACLAGLLAGLLGIGGGVILVPLFLWLFKLAGMPTEFVVHSAFATSLCIIVPTAVSSTFGHRKRGNVAWRQVFYLATGGAVGAVIGSSLAAQLQADVLHSAFGAMQILVGLKLIFFHPRLPPEDRRAPNPAALGLVGLAGGAFSSFFGVGGGVIAVPLMLMVLRLPIHLAVGNSSALIVVSAFFGTLSYMLHGLDVVTDFPFSLGYVNLLIAAIVAPLTMIFARLGVRLASGISQDKMVKIFALLLILVGVKLFFHL